MAVKKPKKKPKFNQNSAIRGAIRRLFSRSPTVIETKMRVRRERSWTKKDGSIAARPRVEFQCAECGGFFMGKDVQVDHIIPVIDPVKGFETYDIYVERLFCSIDNLQVLCRYDHKGKTDAEKKIRAINRKKQKELENGS